MLAINRIAKQGQILHSYPCSTWSQSSISLCWQSDFWQKYKAAWRTYSSLPTTFLTGLCCSPSFSQEGMHCAQNEQGCHALSSSPWCNGQGKEGKNKSLFLLLFRGGLGISRKKWDGHSHSLLTTVVCNTKGEVELISAWEASATKLKSCVSHLPLQRFSEHLTFTVRETNLCSHQGELPALFQGHFSVRIELRILDLEKK